MICLAVLEQVGNAEALSSQLDVGQLAGDRRCSARSDTSVECSEVLDDSGWDRRVAGHSDMSAALV